MKKSLFAVAAVTAFAGAAQAQSSVTVYGILDGGYVGGNTRLASGSTVAKSVSNKVAISGGESTSRLGFRGNEEIGGGTSAFFTVEVTLAGDTAAVLGGTRQAFVGLAQKGIGKGAVGLQNTLIHSAVGKTDPGHQNNFVGSLIYPTSSNLAVTLNSSQTDAYTVRTSNTLNLQSENIAGLQLNAMYVQNGENGTKTASYNAAAGSTADNGSTNYTGFGIGADFTWQKLLVTANYQSLKSQVPFYTTGNGTYLPANSAWTGSVGGTNTVDNQTYVGATYDFGILKAYAGYVNRQVTLLDNSNNYLKRSAQQVGVRSFITPTVEAWASVGNGRFSAFGTSQPTANIVGYQVGSNYLLSKRTNLYAVYGANGTSSTSNGAFNANNYGIGMRHTF
jgi:predicted porin